ncbi:unnamed protein product [Scytosiphon promiscuus]
MKFTTAVVFAASCACASAFVAPGAAVSRGIAQPTRAASVQSLNAGKYDGKVWDDAAKADVLSEYDASQPWSETNFDPNVKDGAGNKCDASGYYPGETRYKDPIRPDVTFAEYMKQKAEKEAGGN